MRVDEAIKNLQKVLDTDPDADIVFEVKNVDTYYDFEFFADEQDSEEDRYIARKKGHPCLKAVFVAEQC